MSSKRRPFHRVLNKHETKQFNHIQVMCEVVGDAHYLAKAQKLVEALPILLAPLMECQSGLCFIGKKEAIKILKAWDEARKGE